MKIERVNAELQKLIYQTITREVSDPRVQNGIISVTRVDTTQDLSLAKVYVSILNDNEQEKKDTFEALCRASGFIRSSIRPLLKIRNVPSIQFKLDEGGSYAERIYTILDQLNIKK